MNTRNVINVDKAKLEQIGGWLDDRARVFTQYLLGIQRQNGWVSGILELGVFKGKYLSLLANQVAGTMVPIVGVDAFLERHNVRLTPEHRASAEAAIRDAIASVAGLADNVTLIGGFTNEVEIEQLRGLCPAGYSFISIDAGHDAPDVEHDSEMADALLTDSGVFAFDDIYNAACPGVAEGFMRYMVRSGGAIAPFATCGNKTFACRPAMHAHYYGECLELARNVERDAPEMSETRQKLADNEANHWTPMLFGHEVVPFM